MTYCGGLLSDSNNNNDDTIINNDNTLSLIVYVPDNNYITAVAVDCLVYTADGSTAVDFNPLGHAVPLRAVLRVVTFVRLRERVRMYAMGY